MIKAVFFDWSYTLAYGDPGREELYDRVLKELGYEIDSKALMRGIFAADSFVFKENLVSVLMGGSNEEKFRIAACYPRFVFKEAGLEAGDETIISILKTVMRDYREPRYRLYDDTLPTLKALKERGLKIGLVTNASNDQLGALRETGLENYVDLVANAEEAGADKPQPPIFQLALKKAGTDASESIHVGDQYELDILGAKGVGITPVLVDRYDLYPDAEFHPRIRVLEELYNYL